MDQQEDHNKQLRSIKVINQDFDKKFQSLGEVQMKKEETLSEMNTSLKALKDQQKDFQRWIEEIKKLGKLKIDVDDLKL